MRKAFLDGEILIVQLDVFVDVLLFRQPCPLEAEDAVDVVRLDFPDDGAAFVVAVERLDVISFGGELPAGEVGQRVEIVDVFIPVAVWFDGELVGEQLLK